MDHYHVDFETISESNLIEVGSDVYSQAYSTDVLCLAYAFNEESTQLWTPELPAPKRLLDFVATGGLIIGHNIGAFEVLIWNNIMGLKYGWPEIKIEQCEDTMAMAYAMGFPGSLDDASRAAGIPHEKDMKGHRTMLQLCQPRSLDKKGNPIWWTKAENPEKYEILYNYCKQDVEVERALYKRLVRIARPEKKLWDLDYYINRRGVHVDMRSAKQALALVENEKDRLNNKIREITGGAVAMCTATGQLTDWLKSKGLEVPSVAKADVVEMLSKEIPGECRQALLLRQEAAKTSTAKLQSMINGTSVGGRMRGLFQYHGASTGRWSGRRVQLQNLPRQNLPQDKIDKIFEILNSSSHVLDKPALIEKQVGAQALTAVSEAIRGFLMAKPGFKFIAADFSAIEARVIAWLAGEDSVLDVFKGDGKIYELTASGIYKCKVEEISKEDPRRQVGKVAVLALGFQGGVGALQTMCRAYRLTLAQTLNILRQRATEDNLDRTRFLWQLNGKKAEISKEEFFASDLIKQFWREANPNIVQYWASLEQAAREAVANPGSKQLAGAKGREITYTINGSFLWCRLPSGRVLCYPYPKIEDLSPFKGSDKRPTLTYMNVDSYTKKWLRKKSYGGLLAENVTQAVARDLLAEAVIRLEEQGYPVVMHIHDEVVTEVQKDFGSLYEVKNVMSKIPSWAQGLPISAEGWTGERFRK